MTITKSQKIKKRTEKEIQLNEQTEWGQIRRRTIGHRGGSWTPLWSALTTVRDLAWAKVYSNFARAFLSAKKHFLQYFDALQKVVLFCFYKSFSICVVHWLAPFWKKSLAPLRWMSLQRRKRKRDEIWSIDRQKFCVKFGQNMEQDSNKINQNISKKFWQEREFDSTKHSVTGFRTRAPKIVGPKWTSSE